MKRKINEQRNIKNQSDYNKLKIAHDNKCYPDTAKEVRLRIYNDKDIIHYKNVRDEDVVMFADMTAKNLKTGNTAKWTCEALSNIDNKKGLLTRFGIPEQNKCSNLQKITQNIVKLIEQGYKSNWFNNWNELIKSYSDECGDIQFVSDDVLKQSIELPLTSDEKSQYTTVNWFKDVYNLDNGLQVLKPNVVQTTTGIDQTGCSNIITNYFVAALRNKAFGDRLTNLNQEKPKVQRCLRGKEMDNFSINTSELEQRVGAGRKNNSLRGVFSGVGNTMSNREIRRILSGRKGGVINTEFMIAENKNNDMSKIIKESLNNLSVNKRKEILVENKIVRNRFRFLIEGKKTLTKKQTNILFENIINEMVRLSLSGIDKKVINEELVQLLGTMFQSKNGEVMEMFKEKFGNWIADKVVDVDSEILSKSSVKDAINSVDINSVVKLIDCDYLSDLLTRLSVRNWSETLMRVSNPSTVSDILRKTLKDTVDNTNFHNELKNRIKSNLCPVLSDIQNKMNDAENKIKSKVLST
jgi:hypothetical protein